MPPSIHKPIYTDLMNIIEKGHIDNRYYLSPNAAEGILRRVDSQGRKLFPPLRHALEKMCDKTSATHKSIQNTPQLELHL